MKNAQVIDFIVNWLKNYAQQAGVNGFVVGVSGGVDSALTSALCAHTTLPVLAIDMPIHQEKTQRKRGLDHLDWLCEHFENVQQTTVDLTPTFDTFSQSFSIHENRPNHSLSLANARARLRMTTLYYFAGVHGYLVAGTGNKVEDFGVGFYTKYGDGGVDLSPIADLTKTEVRALAKTLGVSDAICQAPPTDGLWGDDRTDEDQLGASYPELEWAMAQKELGKNPADFNGREREVFEILLEKNNANQHKIQPIPICSIPHELKK